MKAKKLAIEAAKTAIKKSKKKKAGRKKLYTEAEVKERARLQDQIRYYEKAKKKLSENTQYGTTWTLKSLRDSKKISEETIQEMISPNSGNNTNGDYFDASNKDDYYNRDFREWMAEEGDEDWAETLMNEYNDKVSDKKAHITPYGDMEKKRAAKLSEYADKIKDLSEKREKIKQKAERRRDIRTAKEIARKNKLETGEDLLTALDKSESIYNMLSNPEKAAVDTIKKEFAGSIIKSDLLKGIPEDKLPIAKKAIYSGVMSNPMEGVRTAIKETVAGSAIQKYGNAAGPVVESLVNIATGKGSASGLGLSMFEGVVTKSGLNKDLMNEKAADLIDSGESTSDKENLKMLARDAVVDIARDVIMSGGQIYAAIPMIIKDVVVDIGKAGIRKLKQKE